VRQGREPSSNALAPCGTDRSPATFSTIHLSLAGKSFTMEWYRESTQDFPFHSLHHPITMPCMVTIEFNGNQEQVDESTTLLALLERSGVESRFCAVEVNLEIVPRSHFAGYRIQDGDQIEVVTLVGGG
jgi:sulfur carrier protein